MLMLTKRSGVIQRQGGNLNSNDQDLLNNFFTNLNQDIQRIPKLSFNQMFNQLFHNQSNQQVKREAANIKQVWASTPHQKTYLKNNDPELAAALEAGDDNKIEKIIGERLKVQFEKKKAEQEKMAKLRNADPNDEEAQKEIEELIRKELVN